MSIKSVDVGLGEEICFALSSYPYTNQGNDFPKVFVPLGVANSVNDF
jgi:hypothetical protein